MASTSAIPQTTPTTQPNVDLSQFGNYSDSARQAIQSGASLQDVQNAYQKVQQQPQQPQQPQKGNFLTHLIPTATSILGGIGGALIPGLGETGVGEIAGYGGGQAVGQGIENLIEGKPWSQDVAKAGIEGAAFGGVGKVLGFLPKALGSTLSGKGASMLENLTESQKGAAQKLADLSRQKATQLNYSGVGANTARQNMMSNNQAFMEQMGLPSHSPFAMDKTGQAFYDTLGAERGAAQDSAGNAQTKGLLENISKAFGINRGEGAILPTDISSTPFDDIFNKWSNRADVAIKDPATGIMRKPTINDFTDNNIPASQLQKLREEIGSSENDYKNVAQRATGPNAKINASNISNVLNQVNKSIEPIVNTEAVNKAIEQRVLSPTERAGYINQYGDKLGNFLADKVDGAKTAQDLTTNLQTGVQMKNISKQAIADLQNTKSASAGLRTEASNDGYGGIADPNNLKPPEENLLTHAINSITTIASGQGKLTKAMQLGDIAAKSKLLPKTISKTGSLLERIGKLSPGATAGAGGLIAAGAQQGTNMQNTQGAGMQGTQGTQGAQGAGGAGAPGQDALNQLYNQLLQQEQSSFGGTQTGSLISALNQLAPQVNKQQIAANAIQQLLPAYQNAGGAQGLGSGLWSQVTGLIPGTAANVYGNQQQATAGALGGALGISPAQAGGLTPQLMSNQQTANPQITALQNLLSLYGGQAAPVAQ